MAFFLDGFTHNDKSHSIELNFSIKSNKIISKAMAANDGNAGNAGGPIRVTDATDAEDSTEVLNVIISVMQRMAMGAGREVLVLTENQLRIYNEFMAKFSENARRSQGGSSGN